jgi:hypothetical protein
VMPFHQDEAMAVLGINTARSLTRQYGRINQQQVEQAQKFFAGIGSEVVKVVVTHHPFDVPAGSHSRLVGRAVMAMEGLAKAGVDLLLAGHLHLHHTGLTAQRYQIKGHSALVVQAGTTISTRGRGEANSFNVVRIERPAIAIERYVWSLEQMEFKLERTDRFVRGPTVWNWAT